jgi:hypothetical protein
MNRFPGKIVIPVHNTVVRTVGNLLIRWAGWTGVCVFSLALVVALSIRHDATVRHQPVPTAPSRPDGGYQMTFLSPSPHVAKPERNAHYGHP